MEEGGIATSIRNGDICSTVTRALTMDIMEEVRMDLLDMTERMEQVSKKIKCQKCTMRTTHHRKLFLFPAKLVSVFKTRDFTVLLLKDSEFKMYNGWFEYVFETFAFLLY